MKNIVLLFKFEKNFGTLYQTMHFWCKWWMKEVVKFPYIKKTKQCGLLCTIYFYICVLCYRFVVPWPCRGWSPAVLVWYWYLSCFFLFWFIRDVFDRILFYLPYFVMWWNVMVWLFPQCLMLLMVGQGFFCSLVFSWMASQIPQYFCWSLWGFFLPNPWCS